MDLIFYNRILKCCILIDLKIENKTIGIIICEDKNDTLVNMTLPEENQ
ncbi:hypothetical protein DXA30_06580 [Fusobacterium ulcerans]|nr:hypothetical protein DXA30_06580 [Fusobacterium ulcerans]